MNAFYFAPAMKLSGPRGGGQGGGKSLSAIFSTHPSLERRLAELEKIQKQLGQVTPQ